MRTAAIVTMLCLALSACSSERPSKPAPQSELWSECKKGVSPYVVYLHGLGGSSADLRELADAVEAELPGQGYCLYDRLNAGSSPKDPGEHSLTDSVDDLQKVLDHAEVPPPYVLVGHSFGGLVATSYVGRHPEKVAGIVLADAVLPFETELFTAAVEATLRSASAGNIEHVDLLESYSIAGEAQLPNVPFVYVDATRQDLATEWGARGYQAALKRFIGGLPQGRLVLSDTDHIGVLDSQELRDAVVSVVQSTD